MTGTVNHPTHPALVPRRKTAYTAEVSTLYFSVRQHQFLPPRFWQRPGFWPDLAGGLFLAGVVFPLIWGLLHAIAEYG